MEGVKIASFANWYDKFQFDVTRDFLATSLGHPDLQQGVCWLSLIQVGGFPQVFNRQKAFGRTDTSAYRCPLCKSMEEHVEIGWDWIHLVLQCTDPMVIKAKGEYLDEAIKSLIRKEHIGAFYDQEKDVPPSAKGLPYHSLKSDTVSGMVAFRIVIWLIGGCLCNPRESTYILLFGQCNFVLTGKTLIMCLWHYSCRRWPHSMCRHWASQPQLTPPPSQVACWI